MLPAIEQIDVKKLAVISKQKIADLMIGYANGALNELKLKLAKKGFLSDDVNELFEMQKEEIKET